MEFHPDDYAKARKKVLEKKEFYGHLSTYLVVCFSLFLLNMLTAPYHWWFIYPTLGWGIGLFAHFVNTFGFPGTQNYSKEWEEEEIQRELHKMKKHRKEEKPEHLDLKELEKRPQPRWRDDELV